MIKWEIASFRIGKWRIIKQSPLWQDVSVKKSKWLVMKSESSVYSHYKNCCSLLEAKKHAREFGCPDNWAIHDIRGNTWYIQRNKNEWDLKANYNDIFIKSFVTLKAAKEYAEKNLE